MRLEHLLHEVLTETTSAQPIVLLYPQLISMLHPQGINCNKLGLKFNMKSWTSAYKSHALYTRRNGKFTKRKNFHPSIISGHIYQFASVDLEVITDVLHFNKELLTGTP